MSILKFQPPRSKHWFLINKKGFFLSLTFGTDSWPNTLRKVAAKPSSTHWYYMCSGWTYSTFGFRGQNVDFKWIKRGFNEVGHTCASPCHVLQSSEFLWLAVATIMGQTIWNLTYELYFGQGSCSKKPRVPNWSRKLSSFLIGWLRWDQNSPVKHVELCTIFKNQSYI